MNDCNTWIMRLRKDVLSRGWASATTVSNAIADVMVRQSSSEPLYLRDRLKRRAETGACTVAPAFGRLESLPLQVMDGLVNRFDPGKTAKGSYYAKGVPAIVAETNAFLDSVPGRGALLVDTVSHVSRATGQDTKHDNKEMVREVILRHFRSNGQLVWK
jgi:hypothetical protein